MYFLMEVLREFTLLVERVARPILDPPIGWINRVTGASSVRMIPWLFGMSFVCDIASGVLDSRVNPLNMLLVVVSNGYWCHICTSVARELERYNGGDVLPNFVHGVSILIMRAILFVMALVWLITLPFDYSTGAAINWTGTVAFLLGLTAAVQYHGGRKSLVRKGVEKVGEALRSLVPQPSPVPAFVGG
jgi:hypothetical protein